MRINLLIQRHNYQPISRETIAGKRHYCLPDGSKVASVTTILDATKSEESKQALNNWRKRVGPRKAQEITTEAAGRGTRMHKFLEDYIVQGVINPPGTNPFSIQSHKMANHIIENGLKNVNEVWGVEVSKKLMKFIPEKGSVALNGTSLTVNNVVENIFYINLIPHTLLSTNLSSLKIGGMVNIEIDMIARYLQNFCAK